MIPRGKIYLPFGSLIKDFISALWTDIRPGHELSDLEDAFAKTCGAAGCTAFPHARMGIYFLLKALKLPPGSGIILPPLTTQYIIDAIKLCGHQPVYIDIDPVTLSVSPDRLSQISTPNCRVLILTYLYGITPEVDQICRVAEDCGWIVIEDISQHLGGSFNGKPLGSFGKAAVYSSSVTKALDTYGGGLTITNDPALHAELQEMRRQLQAPSRIKLLLTIFFTAAFRVLLSRVGIVLFVRGLLPVLKKAAPGIYTFINGGFFDFKATSEMPDSWLKGYTSVQAHRGLQRLSMVSKEMQERKANAEHIKKSYSGTRLRFPASADGHGTYWQLLAYCDDQVADLAAALRKKGVDTGRVLLPVCPDLSDHADSSVELTHARELKNRAMIIPAYPGLSAAELEKIVTALQDLG